MQNVNKEMDVHDDPPTMIYKLFRKRLLKHFITIRETLLSKSSKLLGLKGFWNIL